CNLISLLALFERQITVKQVEYKFMLECSNKILLEGRIINKLMYIYYALPTTFITTNNQLLWHKRLGHPGILVLKQMGLPYQDTTCSICEINKSHKQAFNHRFDSAVPPLECNYLDLIGPIVPASVSSCQYILTIVDQATLFKIVKFLKKKCEAFDQFSLVKIFMENQQDRKIKRVVSDRGGKFLNNKFKELSEKHGFIHIFSPPKTPQHNGYSERANRTILEKTRCLLGSSNLPNRYWEEAMSTATLLSNLVPTPSRVNKSPYSLWTNQLPQVRRLKTIGCLAFISTPKNHRSWKLGPAGTKRILLGYENENMCYHILRISDAKIIITKHATFNENESPKLAGFVESSPLNLDNFSMMVDEAHLVEHEEDPNCSMMVDEVWVDSLDESPLSDVVDEAHTDEQEFQSLESVTALATTSRIKESRCPTLLGGSNTRTFKGALQSPEKDFWKAAIDNELCSMESLNVWEVVEQQESCKLVGTTWVFKIKKNHSNEVTEYKAQLCAQGFTQIQGVDFEKTYAPTGRLNSLQTLIALAAAKNRKLHQIDIKSAFLNAPLREEVYLHVPQGLPLDQKKHCLRLKKAIYGLKQAPLAWYQHLKEYLLSIDFVACVLDACIFYRAGSKPMWLYINVDDIAVVGEDIEEFKNKIALKFEIKDLGSADLMLGVKITHNSDSICLDQKHFAESLLDQYSMGECRPVSTPLVPNEHLSTATEEEIAVLKNLRVNYRSAIGSINYLSTATRPDLSFAVSCLSQYLENPGLKHWQAFMHVLRYLKGSLDVGLRYPRGGSQGITAWSDADWGNCRSTRRSVTGYLATFHGCLVLWKTRKQPSWSEEAGILKFTTPITVWEDNQGCISTANGDCNFNSQRMKHVDIQLHFVKEVIRSSIIKLCYAPSSGMLADFLTKLVNKVSLVNSLEALGILRIAVRGDVKEPDLIPSKRLRSRITTSPEDLKRLL
ncbi:hypothetical protein O181_055185, partial [Austropuccinia psidii MF-1]|nr:hypothetical protein [Austropuccinia psidii MF-1]